MKKLFRISMIAVLAAFVLGAATPAHAAPRHHRHHVRHHRRHR